MRPFVLTSAPEDTYLSIHIRCTDDFTDNLSKALGCSTGQKSHATIIGSSTLLSMDVGHSEHEFGHTVHRILPRVLVQTLPEKILDQVFSYEVVVLVGVGEGVLPFASILKSIWYRMNRPREALNLHKVYFFWICYDFKTFEWFRSILLAIEFQDLDTCIEIYPVSPGFADSCVSTVDPSFPIIDMGNRQYLTSPVDEATATKNLINSAINRSDIVTGLKATTRLGPPHWEEILSGVRCAHEPAMVEIGVFYQGPKEMGAELKETCTKKEAFVWEGGRF